MVQRAHGSEERSLVIVNMLEKLELFRTLELIFLNDV